MHTKVALKDRCFAFNSIIAFVAVCLGVPIAAHASVKSVLEEPAKVTGQAGEHPFREEIIRRWYDPHYTKQMLFGTEIEVIAANRVTVDERFALVGKQIAMALGGNFIPTLNWVRQSDIGDIYLKLDASTQPIAAVEIVTQPLPIGKMHLVGKLLDYLGDEPDILDARAADKPLGVHINTATGISRQHQQQLRNLVYNFNKIRTRLHAEKPLARWRESHTRGLGEEAIAWLEAHPSFFAGKHDERMPSSITAKERDINVGHVLGGGGNRIEYRYPDTDLGSTDKRSDRYKHGSRNFLEEVRFIAAMSFLSALGRLDQTGGLIWDPAGELAWKPTPRSKLEELHNKFRSDERIGNFNLKTINMGGRPWLLSKNRQLIADNLDKVSVGLDLHLRDKDDPSPGNIPPHEQPEEVAARISSRLLETIDPSSAEPMLRNQRTGKVIAKGFEKYEELKTPFGVLGIGHKRGLMHLFTLDGGQLLLAQPSGAGAVSKVWLEGGELLVSRQGKTYALTDEIKQAMRPRPVIFSKPKLGRYHVVGFKPVVVMPIRHR